MKKNNLFDTLDKGKQERIVISSCNKNASVAYITELRFKVTSILDEHKDLSIILCSESNFEIALMLLVLDGICNKIVILPKGVDLEPIIKKINVDLILYGEGYKGEQSLFTPSYDMDIFFLDIDVTTPPVIRKSINNNVETEWVLCTSGTTGIPKLVSHTVNSLTSSVKKNSNDNRWGLVYDLNRLAGLQVFFQSIFNSNLLVIPNSSMGVNDRVNMFIKFKVNSLSATPTLWRKLLMLPVASNLQLSSISLGGEISDSNILNALKKKYPRAKIIHIYASTELGSCFSINDCLAGFPVSYFSTPPSNCILKISDHGTLLVKSKGRGTGYIKGPSKKVNFSEFFDTGDLVTIKGDRCYFSGRISGVINVGGAKVYPEAVEEVLRGIPGIVDARVFPKENAIMGQLVAADIVLQGKSDLDRKTILSRCIQHLDRNFIPVKINFVENITTNNNGKVDRK
jgi:acyl-CoA synthetase (AMP-forming)/AMP-acid ligase II